MQKILKYAAINAFGTVAYVMLVASFIFYLPDGAGSVYTLLVPIVMLLLAVFSAGVTGSLIFGRPVVWYLGGMKSEALKLLVATLIFLFIILLVALTLLFFSSGVEYDPRYIGLDGL